MISSLLTKPQFFSVSNLLQLAVENNQVKMVRFLLAKGAYPQLCLCDNGTNELHTDAQSACLKKVESIMPYFVDNIELKDKFGAIPLQICMWQRKHNQSQYDITELLILNGASVNSTFQQMSVLYMAVED